MTWLSHVPRYLRDLAPFIIPEISGLILILVGIFLAVPPFKSIMERWVKWTIVTCLCFGLLTLTYDVHERMSNDKSTRTLIQQTTETVKNTKILVQGTKELADSTNIIANETKNTLARLARMEPVVDAVIKRADEEAKRVSARRFVDMPPSQLAENANSIADVMKDWAYSYSIEDRQIDIVYYDRLEGMGSHWTPRQQDDWLAEERKKRAELRAKYEDKAQTFVDTANRIRSVMLDKLSPLDRIPEDEQSRAWFENPRSDKAFMLHLDNMATYLKSLAKRMLSSDKPSRC